MGIQATMTIGDKSGAVMQTIATAGATYPAFDQVRLVSLVKVLQQHRDLEIYNIFKKLINYARDNNIYQGSGSIAVVANESTGAIKLEAIAANIVDGDIALMIVGSSRNEGGRNIIDNAHQQLLDAMREAGRITA